MSCAVCRTMWAAALLGSLVLAGCHGGEKKGAGSVEIDQTSAKATLDTIAQAFRARDGQALVACLPPDYKDSLGPTFLAVMDMAAKADALKKTIRAKFGKDAAELFAQDSSAEVMVNNGLLPGTRQDGTIDWDKVRMTEVGDTAAYEIGGKRESLRKIDGKWYMVLRDLSPQKAKAQGETKIKIAKAMAAAYADLDKQVADGAVGKDDLQKALQEAMNKAFATSGRPGGAN